MNKKSFALFTALTLMLLSIAQPALARADRAFLSGTEQTFFGIPGSVWLADGLVQQRDVPLTGTFDFGGMQGTETQIANAVLDPLTGSGRVWRAVTYTDSDSGVTCSGTRVGRLDQFLVTATVIEPCSDGSLFKGRVQDVLIIVPPGSPVPTEVHSKTVHSFKNVAAHLALAGSRAWDSRGVTSLEALQAPFLITNDDLAIAVATSDTGKQMLDSLSSAGVTGLALWPEDLRHPFSLVPGKSILSPQDFEGANVRAIGSKVTYLLIENLGGKPAVEADDFQVAESGLRQGASLPGTPTATGNVIFFPKYQVLVANGAAFEALSLNQKGILRAAAAATQAKAIAEHPSDVENSAAWCAYGGTIVLASEAQIAAFEKAAQPVFEAIEQDPINKEYIAAIRELKAKTPASPGAKACGPGAAQDNAETWSAGLPPNGVWRVELSVDDLVKMGLTALMAEKEWAGVYTFTYQDRKLDWHFKGSKVAMKGDVRRTWRWLMILCGPPIPVGPTVRVGSMTFSGGWKKTGCICI